MLTYMYVHRNRIILTPLRSNNKEQHVYILSSISSVHCTPYTGVKQHLVPIERKHVTHTTLTMIKLCLYVCQRSTIHKVCVYSSYTHTCTLWSCSVGSRRYVHVCTRTYIHRVHKYHVLHM